MQRIIVRLLAATVVAAGAAAVPAPPVAHASPVPVFPGMEIRQNTNLCTLGFVDPALRIAVTAGHCRGNGAVTDKDGNAIGGLAMYRDNTPNGSTVSTNDSINDYEGISLAGDVIPSNVLPGGRPLVSDPGVSIQKGQTVCHFGVATGETCGTVEAVNNGWFTMAHGVVSQQGDSGGPVYITTDDGRAVIVGVFNSTWGDFPAAVSWNAIRQQISEDVNNAPAATIERQAWQTKPS
ncbi:MAG: hypothetical protein QOH57_3330 [Mycobacterium sp.]|nr:hypothetical protein [Mycobacterium sp.]